MYAGYKSHKRRDAPFVTTGNLAHIDGSQMSLDRQGGLRSVRSDSLLETVDICGSFDTVDLNRGKFEEGSDGFEFVSV